MPNELHKEQTEDRTRQTELIVRSSAKYKIIIAGPGTGKSFIFKEVLKANDGAGLALTFINNLAHDLQRDLDGLAEAYTFHGYCKKLLHKISVEGIDTNFNYFPKLYSVIQIDADLLITGLSNLEEAFRTLTEDKRMKFFLERGNYYNAVGHTDAVYRVLKYFQSGQGSLPSYSQIVVDEYQDFNALEVAFIDELEKTSPVLIVGDDDQAIYDFKNASPQYIRSKYSNASFEKFELPYCSRCTKVIVEAVHDVTQKAKSINKLQGRIEKQYLCFLPGKEEDSTKYPKIVHVSCSVQTQKSPYIAKFIENEIKKISQDEIDSACEGGYPCVLILGPSHYTGQVFNYLKSKFPDIEIKEKPEGLTPLDGYKILLRDSQGNLGWRIIMECFEYPDKAPIIRETHDNKKPLLEFLNSEFVVEHLDIVSILIKLKSNDEISEEETRKLIQKCELSIEAIRRILGIEDESGESDEGGEKSALSIKITTINGSKGLSADYVFLIGMNNGIFPSNRQNPTDNEICQFIVGLTRTRKKCYLISNSRFGAAYGLAKSIFIDWIHSSRLERLNVNAEYFRNN